MKLPLPQFPYHPDPVGTGALADGDVACASCGRVRGVVYVGPVHAEIDHSGRICPWCIADGSAAARLGVVFTDDHPLLSQGLDPAIVAEVTTRTPGFDSWQQGEWLAHCGDACAFHGDATAADLRRMSAAERRSLCAATGLDAAALADVIADDEPGGDLAFYKFVCRKCGTVRLGWDMA